MNIRHWLRKVPQPTHVQIGRPGDPRGQTLEILESRTKWADAEESILAIAQEGQPISCLDSEGKITRSFTYNPERLEEEEDTPAITTTEANEAFMTRMGEIISRSFREGSEQSRAVYEKALDSQKEAYQLVKEALIDMTRMTLERNANLEERWLKAFTSMAKAQAESMLIQAEANAERMQDGGVLAQIMPILNNLSPELLEAGAKAVKTIAPDKPESPPPADKKGKKP